MIQSLESHLKIQKTKMILNVANAATINIQLDDGAGGAFTTVATIQAAALAGVAAQSSCFNIPVPTGYKYKFTKGGLAGVTESIDIFSIVGV